MNNEYLFLASEVRELEELLAAIPAQNVIDRMSLQARLDNAKKALEVLPKGKELSKARLTFRGKPVFETHGISADFGAKATEAFSDVFAMFAADLSGNLRPAGPIPEKDKNQLLITGTALGSFGFEFELPQRSIQSPLFPELEISDEAVKKIETLFRLTAEGTDDEIADVISETQPRAIKKLYEFLELLVQQEAWCGLEFGDRFFRYADYEQIKSAANRLKDDNIRETDEKYRGEFQGVLPTARTFEFKLSDQDGLIIRGKLDRTLNDPDNLNREWLHKPIIAQFHVMTIGQGRPRYTLLSLDNLSVEAGQ